MSRSRDTAAGSSKTTGHSSWSSGADRAPPAHRDQSYCESAVPSPCFKLMIACGTLYSKKLDPPSSSMYRWRAATIGSVGTANGSLSMITHDNCSPRTSTPCQKLEVANNTAFGVCAKLLQQASLRRTALQQTRKINLGHRQIVKRLHAGQTGRKHKRAALRGVHNLDYFCRRGFGPFARTRDRASSAADTKAPGFDNRKIDSAIRSSAVFKPQPLANKRKVAGAGKRRRGQHYGVNLLEQLVFQTVPQHQWVKRAERFRGRAAPASKQTSCLRP